MAQYNTLNVKLPNLQINESKSGTQNGTELTLKISSKIIGASNDESNFPHKLFLNKTQVLRLHKAFANNSLANIKLPKTQFHKIGQSGAYLGLFLKNGLLLMKNVLKPLAKSVLIPLGLTAPASATDAAIQKTNFRSGRTTLIISNDIMKVVKSLEESGLLIKDAIEKFKIKEKKKVDFSLYY